MNHTWITLIILIMLQYQNGWVDLKFFLANGRLGNQLFQYVFLKTHKKGSETIIVSGFEDLKEVFDIDDIVNLNKNNRWIRKFLYSICKPILCFLADKRVFSSVSIQHEHVLKVYKREASTFAEKTGLFRFITFVKLGYFQSEEFFDNKIALGLKIKINYLLKAENFLKNIPNENKVFIHIRRGDYHDYSVYGKSTLLPINYFKEQIEWFLENKENPFFIFLSDEVKFIEKEFEYIENKIISSGNHFGTDLAIMSKCNSAILSPSSFGWWGSYLMKDRDVVVAPKHWLGFNSKVEYQAHGKPSYARGIVI